MSSTSPQSVSGASDRLFQAIRGCGAPACVGLDPVLEKLPMEIRARHHEPMLAIEEFCKGVIEAAAGKVAVIKPQSACFERYGPAGMKVLASCIRHAREKSMVVILDAKRGDIGTTAEHYAAAAFGTDLLAQHPGSHSADFLTVNAYLGFDTVEPYLTSKMHGIFVLVRTSNPGSDAVQTLKLADGRTIAQMMAEQVTMIGSRHRGLCGMSNIGAVVGATKSAEAADLRKRMPDTWFLIPGYGTQGGTLEDIKPMLRSRAGAAESGVIVNASRAVLYPAQSVGRSWQESVADAAGRFADEMRSLFA